MLLHNRNNIGRDPATPYAVPSDFCRLFSEEMRGLYVLALLLTAHEETAELCFAAALEDCVNADGVFRNWAPTWARRAIAQNAIRLMQVAPERASEPAGGAPVKGDMRRMPGGGWPLAAVTQLPTFERFVFVLTVLELYPVQECKVLLECSRLDVVRARTCALRRLGEMAVSDETLTAPGDSSCAVQPKTTLIPHEYAEPLSKF